MPLENITSIHMDEFASENAKDIKKYLEHEMTKNIAEEMIEKIVDKCNGNFLYAKMTMSALKSGKLSLNDVLEGKTGDLDYIYRRYFDRTFPSMNDYEETYYLAISVLAATEERIPESTFRNITGWTKRKQNQYLKVLSPFLTTGREYLGLYHKSLQDWLLSEAADDYMVDKDDGIRKICEGCVWAYEKYMSEMNDYELRYLIPYLEKINDCRLQQVLNNREYAELLMKHAKTELASFRYEDAIHLAKMVWKIYKSIGCYEDAVITGLFLAETTDLMVCLEESEKWCEDSLKIIEQNPHLMKTQLPGNIWMQLSYVYFRQGRWEKSVNGYNAACACYGRCQDISEIEREQKKIEAKMMCANALRNSTDYTEAIGLFEKIEASSVYKMLRETKSILYVNILMNYGWTLHSAGHYKDARRYFESAEEMLRDVDLPLKDVAQIYYLRAVELLNRADYLLAEEYCEKSLCCVKQVYGENAVEICSVLNQQGAIAQKQKKYKKAIQLFKKSYEIRLNYYGDNNLFTTISLRNYGKALLSQGDCTDKELVGKIFEKIKATREKISESGKGIGWLAQIYLDLSDYYRMLLNYKEAEAYGLRAKTLYEKYGSSRDISTCEMKIGMIKYDIGDYVGAKNAFGRAVALNKQCYDTEHPYSKELRMWYKRANDKLTLG